MAVMPSAEMRMTLTDCSCPVSSPTSVPARSQIRGLAAEAAADDVLAARKEDGGHAVLVVRSNLELERDAQRWRALHDVSASCGVRLTRAHHPCAHEGLEVLLPSHVTFPPATEPVLRTEAMAIRLP